MTSRIDNPCLKLVTLAIGGFLLFGCSSRLPLERAPLPFRQAEDSFRLGHYERAVHGYRIFIDSGQTPELVPRAYFKLAQSEFRLGNHDKCLAALDELQHRYPGEEWRQVYELRGDAEYARGNAVSAVLFWEQALDVAEPARKKLIHRRIVQSFDRMDSDTLRATRAVVADDETRQLIDETLAGRSDGSRPEASATIPAGQHRVPKKGPIAGGELDPGEAEVGVLLPLSGKYATYGERSLAGIRLALAGSGIDVLVRDTEGAPRMARAAIDELAQNESVIAVIGPLRSKVAQAATPRAERAGLPLLSLAQRRSISSKYVLQTAMTHQRQAAQLAEFAIGTAGLRRFGVIFPRNASGSALSQAFQAEVKRLGGTIVGALAYEPGTEEFAVEVVTLQRWVDGDRLQAVFIPDFASTAVVLATALREARPSVYLLGSNGWNDPGRLGAAADVLDGAVFVDGFFMGSQRPATQRFLAAYRAENDEMPGILEAQAYDAAQLVRETLLDPKSISRDGFISAVRGLGVFAGAAGDLSVGPDGVVRELFVLELDGHRIREIRAAGDGSSRPFSYVPSPASTPAPPPESP